MQRGNSRFVGKDYPAAINHFLKHAASNPVDSADAFALVAECYRRATLPVAPINTKHGITLVTRGRKQSAEYYYRLALNADGDHIKSLRGLADLLPNKSDKRFELLENAVRIQPGTLTLIDFGDCCRSQRKDYNRAYELYCRAQKHAPRDETAYRRLNDICRRLDRHEEAKQWSERWKGIKSTKRNVGPPAN